MLLKTLFSQRPLINKSTASIFIYLRDHDQLINPTESRLKLSYLDPKKLVQGAPIQKFLPYKLEKDMQELLDRQIFEEYKNKILRGIIDEVPVVRISVFRNNLIHFGVKKKSPLTTITDLLKSILCVCHILTMPMLRLGLMLIINLTFQLA